MSTGIDGPLSVVGYEQQVVAGVRRALLRLAHQEDEIAADEAARVRYWEPPSISAVGHRAAAAALRLEADKVEAAGAPR